jgi:YggT family protein
VTGSLVLVVYQILRFYEILIVVYVLMSWFPMRGILYDIYSVLASVVEPYVGLFRRVIPPIAGFDFSPMAAILVLEFVSVAIRGLG